MRKLLLSMLIMLSTYIYSQCVVTSSNGYNVNISLNITSVVVHTTPPCPSGFNFDYVISYNITFTGSNIPANLYTMQGNVLAPGYPKNFYNLPNVPGSGTLNSQGNTWTTNVNCLTAQPSNFNPTLEVEIQGPGIPSQTISCPSIALGLNTPPIINTLDSIYHIEVFPNPTDNLVKFVGYLPSDDEVEIMIFDLQWQMAGNCFLNPQNGKVLGEITTKLKSGTYIVIIKQKNIFQERYRLIISN